MRVVFFGTPDFAVPALRALVGEGFDVTAVVTQPDRPQGRSRSRALPPPVKVVAEEEGLPVLQPERPNDSDFIESLRARTPDVGVVVAYGHILKPDLLAVPSRGMLNVHGSLLPELRGAAPVEHAILEGLEETGVSIMQMDERMDTGPVLLRVPTPVAPDETGGELRVRLAELGALALVEALALLEVGAVRPLEQDDEAATYAPKITTAMARIRWEEPADRIARQVRAFDPAPGAWTTLDDTRVKFFGPKPGGTVPAGAQPGEIVDLEPAFLVATGNGALSFVDVQPAGRGRIATPDWIRGRGATVGDRFA